MSTGTKIITFLVLLGAALAGVAVLLTDDPGTAPVTIREPRSDDLPDPVPTDDPGALAAPTADPVRTRADRQTHDAEVGSGADFAQGVRGFLVNPAGDPPPPTVVYLVRGPSGDLLEQLRMARRGIHAAPLARAESDSRGHFALGLERAEPAVRYEVRVASEIYPDRRIPGLTLKTGQWHDAGRIALERGAMVFGRVSIRGSGGRPAAGAEITVVPAGAVHPTIAPTPGREDGLIVLADAKGRFQLRNVPPGEIAISAVAPRFARVEKTKVAVKLDARNQVLFELPPGRSIRGIVTDGHGDPIAGAHVAASALSTKTPASGRDRCDPDGAFEVLGLLDGPYSVLVTAPGYARTQLEPVIPGRRQVRVILEAQGGARIRVLDKNGRLLHRYTLTVKAYTKGRAELGRTDVPTQEARTGTDGTARVRGLDPGDYVFQVEARDHCKGFSKPFRIAPGGREPVVELQLDQGGSLDGFVVDGRGTPVARATVKTLPNDFQNNPLSAMFRSAMPFKITQTTAKTNHKGYFRIELLTPGKYQLEFTHRDHTETRRLGVVVQRGQRTTLDNITMVRGTVVSGIATVRGNAVGQVRIVIRPAPVPGKPPTHQTWEAVSDADGQFTIAARLPPGRYEATAARQDPSNPVLALRDVHASSTRFKLAKHQEDLFLPLDIRP